MNNTGYHITIYTVFVLILLWLHFEDRYIKEKKREMEQKQRYTYEKVLSEASRLFNGYMYKKNLGMETGREGILSPSISFSLLSQSSSDKGELSLPDTWPITN